MNSTNKDPRHMLQDCAFADVGLCPPKVLFIMTPAISPVDTKYGSRTHLEKSFHFMVADSTVLHASLAVASMHFDYCRGQRTLSYSAIFHRGEAIKLVNKMLRDEERSNSDEMIASIVRLASFEVELFCSCNIRAAPAIICLDVVLIQSRFSLATTVAGPLMRMHWLR